MKVLGLINCYNTIGLDQMTENRNIASTSFLGRYAFIDFPLSNFYNSGINHIGILAKDHIRSLLKHVQNSHSWTGNTKLSSFSLLYDEKNAGKVGYHNDIANINENEWFFDSVSPDYVIITSPQFNFICDFKKELEDHIASKSGVTLLYTQSNDLKRTYIGSKKITVGPKGKLTKIETNKGEYTSGDISIDTLIMDYKTFTQFIEFATNTSSFFSFNDVLEYISPNVLVRCKKFDKYVRSYDSLKHYLEYSLEVLKDEFNSIFDSSWPIYTRTYDTPPATYYKGCKVSNSYISNGCKIKGTVINSIIGRDVVINEGAVIKDSVIGTYSTIGSNITIENVVADKASQIVHKKEVIGSKEDPIYIKQGDLI